MSPLIEGDPATAGDRADLQHLVGALSSILSVARQAFKVYDAEKAREDAQFHLEAAYVAWKRKHGIERVERDTLDWTRMMVATKAQFQALEKAKRAERYARGRLSAIILWYREGGAA
ncbi:hypothetical protein [Xanthobacter autotrophicus]|uniref:hypothetical protein n=1 Tax=Xanthobacter autotrophicus TaxID=280 RepID=UPI00372A2819